VLCRWSKGCSSYELFIFILKDFFHLSPFPRCFGSFGYILKFYHPTQNQPPIILTFAGPNSICEGFFSQQFLNFANSLLKFNSLVQSYHPQMVHTSISWRDQMPERDGTRPPVWCITFKPDGTQLVLAVGNRVLVFDPVEGELIQSLKGHKDTVYCVAYSADGKRFASGGADKNVIIWTSKCTGFLKFTHNESIQCLSYNPVNHALASCTSSDFGLWSPEQKKVEKNKVMSKVCCCDWTRDGQILALGHFDGKVSLYDKKGEMKTDFQRVTGAPIWCLKFNPSPTGASMDDLLAVGCWDKTLSFWGTDGSQQGKDRKLDFDPCSLQFMGPTGEYIVLGGTDKKVTLWTREGFKLKELGKPYKGWVWSAVPRPKHNEIAVGTNDGELAVLKLTFATVHGLFR